MSSLKNLSKARSTVLISIFSILLSISIASILILAVGKSPILAFSSLLKGALGSHTAIANTFNKTVPLVIAGLACSFAFKGGILNIGVEGQIHIGAIFAYTVLYFIPNTTPPIVAILLALFASILGGMLWGGLIGTLKVNLKINEVIIAILLNYIAIEFTSYMINYPFISSARLPETEMISKNFRFLTLVKSTQFSASVFIAFIAVLVTYIVINKTVMGYKIRAVGDNYGAALAGGISVNKTVIITMLISGAIGGLIGATELMGTYGKLFNGFSGNVGFTGLAVAVLANNNPLIVILSGLLFGIMDSGARMMNIRAGLSANMVVVIQGLVIFFIATPGIFEFVTKKRRIKK
ncbi:ABC transporter permease [Peptoniphilus indolicus]|nr:ABC transporter permease [Peptoniphilus indolicus]SUB75504.1 ABC-type uncharacterized transport system, permease component [Peptoniphilus indolicus]